MGKKRTWAMVTLFIPFFSANIVSWPYKSWDKWNNSSIIIGWLPWFYKSFKIYYPLLIVPSNMCVSSQFECFWKWVGQEKKVDIILVLNVAIDQRTLGQSDNIWTLCLLLLSTSHSKNQNLLNTNEV